MDAIVLVCAATTMSVTIPLERLSGASQGSDLYLLNDPTCEGVLSEDGTAIVITTDLTGCNNNRMVYHFENLRTYILNRLDYSSDNV